MELIASPNPHFIPGYTGFCPQYKYRIGNTYGTTTHKVLLDPTVHHAEKLVLTDRTADDYKTFRPAIRDIDIVNERQGDTIYKHPMVPGYEGFVPKEHAEFGQRYTVQATEALSDFERLQNLNRAALNQITKIGYLQDNKWDPKTLEDKELTQSDFKLPLLEVRPECGGLLRNVAVSEPPITPPNNSPSPYFSDNIDPEKRHCQHFGSDNTLNSPLYNKQKNIAMYDRLNNSFLQQERYVRGNGKGFTGHIPFGYSSFGKTNEAMTNSSLCDFTSNYRKRLSNEWAPINLENPDPPVLIQPADIYHKHMGQLPNYGGHIPGAIFRYGKTYGNDSRDAKRWLRGDFSN